MRGVSSWSVSVPTGSGDECVDLHLQDTAEEGNPGGSGDAMLLSIAVVV